MFIFNGITPPFKEAVFTVYQSEKSTCNLVIIKSRVCYFLKVGPFLLLGRVHEAKMAQERWGGCGGQEGVLGAERSCSVEKGGREDRCIAPPIIFRKGKNELCVKTEELKSEKERKKRGETYYRA